MKYFSEGNLKYFLCNLLWIQFLLFIRVIFLRICSPFSLFLLSRPHTHPSKLVYMNITYINQLLLGISFFQSTDDANNMTNEITWDKLNHKWYIRHAQYNSYRVKLMCVGKKEPCIDRSISTCKAKRKI
jgi:hypothetical protein